MGAIELPHSKVRPLRQNLYFKKAFSLTYSKKSLKKLKICEFFDFVLLLYKEVLDFKEVYSKEVQFYTYLFH